MILVLKRPPFSCVSVLNTRFISIDSYNKVSLKVITVPTSQLCRKNVTSFAQGLLRKTSLNQIVVNSPERHRLFERQSKCDFINFIECEHLIMTFLRTDVAQFDVEENSNEKTGKETIFLPQQTVKCPMSRK